MWFSLLMLCIISEYPVSTCLRLDVNAEPDYYGKDDDIIPPQLSHYPRDYSSSNEDMAPAATFLHTPVLDLKWPNATVPYVFHHNMRDSDRKQTVKAMKEFHKHSCIKFIEWTGEPDYIVIEYSIRGECSSHVGRQGGPQPLYLSPRCARSVGVAMHEMLHTLGFTHEHMRPDRDKYVYINYSNIDYAYWKNFEIDSNVKLNDLGASYDFSSLMHYRLCAMSNNSLPTIIAKIKPRTKLIGQRIGFSEQDIIKLNRFYNCSLKANNAKLVLAESESILQTHDCDKNCDCSSRDGSESNAYPHSCVLKIILIVYTYKQLFSYTSVVNIFIFM